MKFVSFFLIAIVLGHMVPENVDAFFKGTGISSITRRVQTLNIKPDLLSGNTAKIIDFAFITHNYLCATTH